MMPASGLARTQNWMQQAIVLPNDENASLRSASDWVKPSKTLTPEERVWIYRNMYPLRMRDALAADYPGLAHYFGEDGFEHFVAAYCGKHPSRSYTLNRLGDFVPRFVEQWKDLKRRAFLYDLARTELALTQVFDEEQTPSLTAAQIAAVPAADWERARLKPIAALRLLDLAYPVPLYLDSVREESKPPVMRPKRTLIAVYRRDYALLRLDLTPAAWQLLQLIIKGRRLGRAIERTWLDSKPRVKEDQLFAWFREWMTQGIFREIQL